MNFKKYYLNGDPRIKIEIRIGHYWNRLMYKLFVLTTFNKQYDVTYYQYMGGDVPDAIYEKIESWYEKPKFWWLGRKGKQVTRSTFVRHKKEIPVKHFKEIANGTYTKT